MARYIKVNNEEVYLTKPQQQAYDQMVNNVRYRARKEGRCGQPDFRKCQGDCGLCAYQRHGMILSTDAAANSDYGFNAFEIEDTSFSVESDTINRMFFDEVYKLAATLVPDGDAILRLHLEEGLKSYTIAQRLNAKSHATIHGRLEKLLKYIRDHREELLG